jgi:hypothetical protein
MMFGENGACQNRQMEVVLQAASRDKSSEEAGVPYRLELGAGMIGY